MSNSEKYCKMENWHLPALGKAEGVWTLEAQLTHRTIEEHFFESDSPFRFD